MRKQNILTLFLLAIATTTFAQVPKKVVVEHFTNTRCGNCASRNPGFYNNLNNQNGMLHMAVHPSSPYSACVLNQHNVSENDGRTNFYGIYGATPRWVIQGDVQSASTNMSDATVFDPYTNQQSDIEIIITQSNNGIDPLQVDVTLKASANNSIGTADVFVALLEKNLPYNAPNGENEHYDVFRKALSNIEGDEVTLPATAGMELDLTFKSSIESEWDLNEMYAIVILQDPSNKEVIQSEAGEAGMSGGFVGIQNSFPGIEFNVYPNPVSDQLFIINEEYTLNNIRIHSIDGKQVMQQRLSNSTQNQTLDLSSLRAGTYLIEIQAVEGIYRKVLTVQ